MNDRAEIKELPPVELLEEFFIYDKDSGELFWKHREAKYFNATTLRTKESLQEQWNSRFAGTVAGSLSKALGYRIIKLFGKSWQAHRIAYRMATGTDPSDMQIDHINGIRADNRIANLRLVSHAENGKNRSVPSDNTSGVIGVSPYQHKPCCWKGQVSVDGKQIKITNPRTGLKYFEDFERPVLERMLEAKRREAGYHNNHGSKLKGVQYA